MRLPGRLRPIVDDVREALEARRTGRSEAALRAAVRPDPARRARFVDALTRPGLCVIAEHKRRAPSSGPIARRGLDETVSAYVDGGAAAMSVLTEARHFDGSLDDLRTASRSPLPCMRKDFVLDGTMVLEAADAGACAVLLLACLHDASALRELVATAHEIGVAVLLEIHAPDELERALASGPDAVGVNARDLTTFEVDIDGAFDTIRRLPAGMVRVAESGIDSPEGAARAAIAGADAILVGSALMRSDDPASLLRALRGAT